jgi:phospholipid/cholesterol/gamma-HCH transport system substrate-binding protein
MAKPFRFRHVRAITGLFVLAAFAAIAATFLYASRAQEWFAPRRELTIILPRAGSMGLRPGADVQVLGTSVGSVRSLDLQLYPKGNPASERRFVARVLIKDEFFAFIRTDSTVSIAKTLGIAGDALILITGGSLNAANTELPREDPLLEASADTGASEMAQDILAQIRDRVLPLIDKTSVTMDELRATIARINDPNEDLQKTLRALRQVAENIEQGKGLAGRLVSDEQLAKDLEAALPRLSTLLDQLRAVLANVERTTADLPAITATVKDQAASLPDLIAQAKSTLARTDALLADLKRTTATLPQTSDRVAEASALLPALVIQTQATLTEVERLVTQVQRSWLLGGAPPAPNPASTIPPAQALPPAVSPGAPR